MLDILLILLSLSIPCSLLGSLLVLKNQTLIADALSHAVLLGIVLGFFITQNLDSPWLIVSATLFAGLTVLSIEGLNHPKITKDAATGLIFTFFFAIAVALISRFARDSHLDLDRVLMGEVLFAPFHRIQLLGYSFPLALIKALGLLVPVLVLLICYYRPLALALFDPIQAQVNGVPVKKYQLGLVLLVALTCVLAFEAVGAIAVIALMVTPAMTARYWVNHFAHFLWLTALIGSLHVVIGFMLAIKFDLTVAGTCATFSFICFLCHHSLYRYLQARVRHAKK